MSNKKIIVLCIIFALTGCGFDTNKTIQDSKKCKDAGMSSTYVHKVFGGVEIVCLSK